MRMRMRMRLRIRTRQGAKAARRQHVNASVIDGSPYKYRFERDLLSELSSL